mgnify:CR=1 FL=1
MPFRPGRAATSASSAIVTVTVSDRRSSAAISSSARLRSAGIFMWSVDIGSFFVAMCNSPVVWCNMLVGKVPFGTIPLHSARLVAQAST